MEAGGITLVTFQLPEPKTVSAVQSQDLLDAPAPKPSRNGLWPAAPPTTSTHSEQPKHGSRFDGVRSLTGSDVARASVSGILTVWLTGIAWLLVRWWHGLCVVAAIRHQAQPWDGGATNEMLDEVRRALQSRDLPPIAVSAHLNRPVMIGLIRSLVILPENVVRAV